MKIKIELSEGETPEQAEETFVKAIQTKKECSGMERFKDEALNEYLEHICIKHDEALNSLEKELKEEIQHAIQHKR